ncbi:MAG TPA: tetratricopeptide repeat protein [Pyrinomonadaceae bacterium]|nr:tetratricopeptide repeat protein [Pyrinomonadaceae bacterium]
MQKQITTFVTLTLILVALQLCASPAMAQGLVIFGDVRIVSENNTVVPKEVMLILRRVPDGEVARQMVSSRGRYRFSSLKEGEYEIVVEADGKEIGRLSQIRIGGMTLSNSPYGYQNDLDLRLRSVASQPVAGGVISAADVYDRPESTRAIFVKAEEAVAKKKFDQAATLLKQVVETDNADFQAWTALGTVYFAQEKFKDAQEAYQHAIAVRPTSPRAQFNLGRLLSSQKKYEEALEPLTKAVELQPTSGDANMLTGEAYLQVKKGSKAIPYLNEAAKHGRPDAHLRLGWLYNAAGMKDKAALEYEEYLKKNPEYQDRNKLKEYITANKKSETSAN